MCPSLFSQTLFRREGEGRLTFIIRKSFGILGFLQKNRLAKKVHFCGFKDKSFVIKTSLVDNKKSIDLSTLTFQKISDKVSFFLGKRYRFFGEGEGQSFGH
jgi:hypothetical protein